MLGAVDLVQPATAPQLFESGPITMAGADPARVVVAAIGSYSCADVWVSRPTGNGEKYDIRLFGRVGDARVLLARVDPSELSYTVDGTREGTIAFSIRGRPVTALELECAPSNDVTNIQFFVQAWHADVESNAAVGPDPTVSVTQGPAGSASLRWPVYLSDGTSAQGVVNKPVFVRLSDGTAAAGTTASPVAVRTTRDGAKTFGVVGSAVASGSAGVPNGTASLGYLWKASGTGRVEILRIIVSYLANGSTAGSLSLRGAHITAEPGSGTATQGTIVSFDRADTSSSSPVPVFKSGHTGAPTRQADLFLATFGGNQSGTFIWSAEEYGKPIVLRASQAEGFEVRAVTASVTTAMSLAVTFHWIEI